MESEADSAGTYSKMNSAEALKIVFESQEPIGFNSADGGMCLEIDAGEPEEIGGDYGINIQIASWNQLEKHDTIRQLEGKRIRVTLEVIDE